MKLNVPGGARLRWFAAGAIVAAVFAGVSLGQAGATVGSGVRNVYVPMTPCRLVDTRPAPDNVGPRSAPLGQADTYTIDALPPVGGCPIPATATALQLNVTAVATVLTYLSIWPGNVAKPANGSSLNPAPGAPPTPNAVTTGLSPAGRFNIFNLKGSVNVVIDVVGYYDDHNFDDRYYPRADADAATAVAIQQAQPKLAFPGTATSIPANQCIYVFAYGVGSDPAAGQMVTGYITDSVGGRVPSINNDTIFLPGTVFKTSQGGTIGYVEVCNPSASAKALPSGWKLVSALKP